MGKTKHLKIRSDWVASIENQYSISTMTLRFLFKSRVSWIESLKFESNQYQIAWYLNRVAQCLNRIFVAIQIAIESNRDLISPITVGGQNVSEFLAKIAKFLTFRLNNCETLQDRCVHAAMHLKSIEFSFRLCDIYHDYPMGDSHLSCCKLHDISKVSLLS